MNCIRWHPQPILSYILSYNYAYVFIQVNPNSIAAIDGRIREGDRILQVYVDIWIIYLFSYVYILFLVFAVTVSQH